VIDPSPVLSDVLVIPSLSVLSWVPDLPLFVAVTENDKGCSVSLYDLIVDFDGGGSLSTHFAQKL